MKLIILFLLVFGLYSSTFKARNSVTKEEISKMEIVYVSSDIETIFSISCDYFDYAFKDRGYMEKNIIDKD